MIICYKKELKITSKPRKNKRIVVLDFKEGNMKKKSTWSKEVVLDFEVRWLENIIMDSWSENEKRKNSLRNIKD